MTEKNEYEGGDNLGLHNMLPLYAVQIFQIKVEGLILFKRRFTLQYDAGGPECDLGLDLSALENWSVQEDHQVLKRLCEILPCRSHMQRAALHCRESLESPITYAKHIIFHSYNISTLAAPKNYPYVLKFPEMVRMQPVGHSLSRNPWSLPHSQPSKWPA